MTRTARMTRYQEFYSPSGKLIATASSFQVYRAVSNSRVRKAIEHETMDWRTADRFTMPTFDAAAEHAKTLASEAS